MTRDPLWKRYRELLRPRPADDVDDEIRFHLEMREREARRAGLSAEEASTTARERFGDVGAVVSELNDIDGARVVRRARAEWLDDLRQDVRFALRSLRRAPAFALTAIATVALAIAGNTVIFSFVDALLLEPLPYANASRLVSIDGGIIRSVGEATALRERAATVIDDLALYRPRSITLSDLDAVRVDGYSTTTNLLSVLGAHPTMGSWFSADAERPGNGNQMVISNGFWLRRYAGDATVVGKSLLVDGAPYTIVGVMPADFHFPATDADFWVPLTVDRSSIPDLWALGGNGFIARLRSGVPLELARSTIATVAPGMRRLNPLWDPGSSYGTGMSVVPLQRSFAGSARAPLLLLFACVGVVLLIACVNVANLLLSRATARERELSIRAALGGGRTRLVRQLLVESLVIATIGGALGLLLALGGVRAVVGLLPPGLPRVADAGIHLPVLLFTAGLTMLTGVAFGLLPAFRATRGVAASGICFGRGLTASAAHHRLAAALVVGEVALAVVLAVTAGLLVRSFARVRDLQPGFTTASVVAARVSPPPGSYTTRERVDALYRDVVERTAAAPGVRAVALVNRLPLAGPIYGLATRIEGQFEDVKNGKIPMVDHSLVVSPGYFDAIGLRLLSGRLLTTSDGNDAAPVVLVSESMAKRFWPNESALGKRIGYPFPNPWLTIVGVVADARLDSLRDTARMAIYIPFAQRVLNVRGGGQQDMYVVARSAGDPASLGQAIRAIVRSIDARVPVSQIRTMDDVVSQSIAKPRFTVSLVTGFALMALLLGMFGIYGVMSYLVSQRTKEMGVRVALGASPTDIQAMVVGRGVRLALGGAAIGLAGAMLATRALTSFLYGVSPTDPLTLALVPLLFIVVATAASYGPARRATAADAVQALRSE